MIKNIFFSWVLILMTLPAFSSYILIPMDAESQRDHLKAYGIAYWVLDQKVDVYWLLNYRGGSFAMANAEPIVRECKVRNVSYEVITNGEFARIRDEIADQVEERRLS